MLIPHSIFNQANSPYCVNYGTFNVRFINSNNNNNPYNMNTYSYYMYTTETIDSNTYNVYKFSSNTQSFSDTDYYCIIKKVNQNDPTDVIYTETIYSPSYSYGSVYFSSTAFPVTDAPLAADMVNIDNSTIVSNSKNQIALAAGNPPSTAGTYVLKATVDSGGNVTYSWVAE